MVGCSFLVIKILQNFSCDKDAGKDENDKDAAKDEEKSASSKLQRTQLNFGVLKQNTWMWCVVGSEYLEVYFIEILGRVFQQNTWRRTASQSI